MSDQWSFFDEVGLVHFLAPAFLLWQCYPVLLYRKRFADASLWSVQFFGIVIASSLAWTLGVRESDDASYLGYSILFLTPVPFIVGVMIWVAWRRPSECPTICKVMAKSKLELAEQCFGYFAGYVVFQYVYFLIEDHIIHPGDCFSARCHVSRFIFGSESSSLLTISMGAGIMGTILSMSVFCLVVLVRRMK